MHPSTEAILKYFAYEHLPEPLQSVSRAFHDLAHALVAVTEVDRRRSPSTLADLVDIEFDGPEVTVALRKLLEAKDAAVRAAL